jgi:flagellar motor switch protein FliM
MTGKRRNNLTADKIQQLLAQVGKKQQAGADQTEAHPYDWTQPHCFNSAQLEKLSGFAQTISSAIATKCSQFFQDSFSAQPSEISQHYAEKFIAQIFENDRKDYYLILKAQKDVSCALIIVPVDTAAGWLKLLLGESEVKEKADNQLSQLEKSLLDDIISRLAEAVTAGAQQLNLTAAKKVLHEDFSLDVASSEELCKISVDVKQGGAEQAGRIHLLLPCSRLLPLVGPSKTEKTLAPEQVKNAMLEYTKQLPVAVTARFPSTELSFEQILTLQKDDILVLDNKVTEPLELVAEGKVHYLAAPAKSGIRLAAKIVSANTKHQ